MNARRHLIVLLCSTWCAGALSQQLVPASDVDLTASYCLGVVQQQLVGAAALAAKFDGTDRPTSQLLSEHQQALQDRLTRLRAYIIPKLQFTDPTALLIARSRGQTDATALVAMSIPNECRSPDQVATVDCGLSGFRATGLWKRVERCKALEFLPY